MFSVTDWLTAYLYDATFIAIVQQIFSLLAGFMFATKICLPLIYPSRTIKQIQESNVTLEAEILAVRSQTTYNNSLIQYFKDINYA